MDRRDFLAAVAAMEFAEAAESAYIPERHKAASTAEMHDLIDEFGFASLITAAPSLRVTHIPVLLDRREGPLGRLVGHIARNNPQHAAFDGKHEALVVFQGPHRYISPNWYAQPASAVPTWNFAAVHAAGRPSVITDDARVAGLLERLVQHFEAYESGGKWSFSQLPQSYLKGMRQGIVAFEMPIETLEGKFKLGQERSAADRAGMLTGLRAAKPERSLAEFTEARFRRDGLL